MFHLRPPVCVCGCVTCLLQGSNLRDLSDGELSDLLENMQDALQVGALVVVPVEQPVAFVVGRRMCTSSSTLRWLLIQGRVLTATAARTFGWSYLSLGGCVVVYVAWRDRAGAAFSHRPAPAAVGFG
jgi:hypothetical protein